MRVLFLPDYTADNPHQRQLASALGRFGTTVEIGFGRGPFPLLEAFVRFRYPEVVHLHWLDPYLLHPNPLIALVKAVGLLAQVAVLRDARKTVDLDGAHPALARGRKCCRRVVGATACESDGARPRRVLPGQPTRGDGPIQAWSQRA